MIVTRHALLTSGRLGNAAIPLSQVVARRGLTGDYLCTPFRAEHGGDPLVVWAVLERTAVVAREGSLARELLRQTAITVDPDTVAWREPFGRSHDRRLAMTRSRPRVPRRAGEVGAGVRRASMGVRAGTW
jgi:hypothetical protein